MSIKPSFCSHISNKKCCFLLHDIQSHFPIEIQWYLELFKGYSCYQIQELAGIGLHLTCNIWGTVSLPSVIKKTKVEIWGFCRAPISLTHAHSHMPLTHTSQLDCLWFKTTTLMDVARPCCYCIVHSSSNLSHNPVGTICKYTQRIWFFVIYRCFYFMFLY